MGKTKLFVWNKKSKRIVSSKYLKEQHNAPEPNELGKRLETDKMKIFARKFSDQIKKAVADNE